MLPLLYNFLGHVSDWLRLPGALIRWNISKSIYRWGRREGPAPCQHRSDVGTAGLAGCEACAGWHRTQNFRHVCPLLLPNSAGEYCCSVAAGDVRPFWGRFVLWFGSVGLILLSVVVFGVWGILRNSGLDVPLAVVAWPPRWSEITSARSEFFIDQARHAYADRRLSQATISLAVAYQLNPGNYGAGLLLAQMWQAGQAQLSDQTYRKLIQDHPDQRRQTAQQWYRALLVRGDFAKIADLAADALRFDQENTPAWLHALFTATRWTGDAAPLRRLADSTAELDDAAQYLIPLELELRQTIPERAIKRLVKLPSDKRQLSSYVLFYHAEQLIQLGATTEALDILLGHQQVLSARERLTLQLQAYTLMGRHREARREVDSILRTSLSPGAINVLASHLIRYPDPALAKLVSQAVTPLSIRETAENYATYTTLVAMTGANGMEGDFNHYCTILRDIAGSKFNSLSYAHTFFFVPPAPSLTTLLPLLQPLPLEVNYALYERYERTTLFTISR